MPLLLFIFGLCLGSFLSVIYKRFNPSQPLFKKEVFFSRSRCPFCHKPLSFYELIPIVSFLIQRGKCRHCGRRISWEYPVIEIISGWLTLMCLKFYIPGHPLTWIIVFLWIFIFFFLFLASLIDVRYLIIPQELLISLFILGAILVIVQPFVNSSYNYIGYYRFLAPRFQPFIVNNLLGGLMGFLFLGSMVFFSKEKIMGWGDAKLGTILGFIIGWPSFILTLFLSFIIGGLYALLFLILKIKRRKDYLAFIPFFSFGIYLTVFYGFKIIQTYFRVFNIQ